MLPLKPQMSSSLLLKPATVAPKRTTKKGTYFVQTWGCQMNEEDSEQMALYLEAMGLSKAESIHQAHVVLLNTCSVRRKPEDKAFSLMGELRLIKERRPEMIIGVCGCMAQLRATEIKHKAPHVDFVVGTAQISSIPGLVEEALHTRRFKAAIDLPPRKGAIVTDIPQREVSTHTKLKSYVPIQYGCDKFCTFCIVPTTRGRERSRPTTDIVREVRQLAERGTKEITLLGQTVNSYGKNLAEGNVPFSQLLQLLAGIPGIERIRYTSPYPRDFKSDLIDVIRDVPQVMEHCHMPLQAGDNNLLKRMKRLYTRESFLEIVDELRTKMPQIGLTTDIIVGFPGETDEEYEGTLDMMRRVRFDGAYMFRYSPRPGTPAADMEQIPMEVSKARLKQLMDLQNQITVENNERLIGQTFEVLVEGASKTNPDMLQGYTRCWRMIHFPAIASSNGKSENLKGQLVNVKTTSAHLWGMTADLI